MKITGLVKAGWETLTSAYERAGWSCCCAVSPIQGMDAIRDVSQLFQSVNLLSATTTLAFQLSLLFTVPLVTNLKQFPGTDYTSHANKNL